MLVLRADEKEQTDIRRSDNQSQSKRSTGRDAPCDRRSPRIDGRPRARSGRRVGPARLTRRCRARAGARTARPTKKDAAKAHCGRSAMPKMAEPKIWSYGRGKGKHSIHKE